MSTIFAKNFILDAWLGTESSYDPGLYIVYMMNAQNMECFFVFIIITIFSPK